MSGFTSSIDPTIALKAGQGVAPPPNPLAIAGQVQDYQRNALAIQDARQTLASQNALGRAAQSAINPDGTFDTAAFMAGVKADPDATFGAVQGIQQGQKTGEGQYTLNQDQLAQATNRTNAVGAGMAGLLSKPDLSPTDIFTSVGGQAASGKPVGEFVQSVLPSMPTMKAGEAPSAYSGRLRTWLAGVAGQSAGPKAAIRTLTPNVSTVGLGGTTQTMDVNPYTNPGAANTTFRNTLSPEGQATPVPGPVGPNGEETTTSRAGYAQSQGLGGLVPGGSLFGSGRPGGLPSSLLNPNRSGASADGAAPGGDFGTAGGDPSPSPTAAPGAPMVTKLGPGQTAGLAASGTASANQWAALQAQVGGTAAAGGGSGGRIYQLQSALGDLQRLGQTGSGPSAGTLNTVKSYLASIPKIGPMIGVDPNGIADFDQANKALTNYASARAGAHGANTDSQLATTLTGNASTHISNLAAVNVVKANIALERMDQAQAQAFQSATDPQTGQPLRPDQFSTWSAGWNRNTDPRAFMVDQLSPQQLRSTLSGMSPTDRTRFQNTYNTAVRSGWVSPPAWASSAPAAAPADGQPSTADMAVNPTGSPAPSMTPIGY